jgi:hypothetical protein
MRHAPTEGGVAESPSPRGGLPEGPRGGIDAEWGDAWPEIGRSPPGVAASYSLDRTLAYKNNFSLILARIARSSLTSRPRGM